jgi:hypothetical protein
VTYGKICRSSRIPCRCTPFAPAESARFASVGRHVYR